MTVGLTADCRTFRVTVIIAELIAVYCRRPSGIPVVPVYEEDEPNSKRKVQRITSPEKWEIKQVNTL